MVLIPELDEVKTKENARELLKDYRAMKRFSTFAQSDDHYDMTSGITYSDMPGHKSNRNGIENATIKRLRFVGKDFQREYAKVKDMDRAMAALPIVTARILTLSYCSKEKYYMNEIAAKVKGYRVNNLGETEEFNYSIKNIERLKSEGLIQFAEAYRGGELLVWKK